VTRTRWIVLWMTLIVIGAAAGAGVWLQRPDMPPVTAEALRKRNLEAVVSASGTVQPKRQVNISANTMGRVTRLAVEEGQRIRAGQFLLEIDPKSLEGQLQRGEASVAAARSSLQQARTAIEQARANLELSQQNLKRQDDLWKDGLTSRELLEREQNEVAIREADLKTRLQEIQTREQQIRQEQAGLATTRYSLSQVTISSPMDGIVIRRNIEEGENVMVGTMNNAGTVLLTIADLSVMEAEIEVDETDIPTVTLGLRVRVAIDAVQDRTFRGHVTEIGNSPIQPTGTQANAQQATNFKVVVTLDEEVPNVRPGFTCTAEITTDVRADALAVPIQALTVREMSFDEEGNLVHEPPPVPPSRFRRGPLAEVARRVDFLFRGTIVEPRVAAVEHTRRETEGVFVLRDNRAVFVPVTTGIAGERYFEVLSGLAEGDLVITGPFSSVRELPDGGLVRLTERPGQADRSGGDRRPS
jgi:HlyD family secretion protein